MSDLIDRQSAIEALLDKGQSSRRYKPGETWELNFGEIKEAIESVPSAQTEITRCKDCKYWRQQTNYAGSPLSFGFCESDNMWDSLYGETCEVSHIDTDDDFYCGYAERRSDD